MHAFSSCFAEPVTQEVDRPADSDCRTIRWKEGDMEHIPQSDAPVTDSEKRRSWNDEHTRALFLPVVGVIGVLIATGLAVATDVDGNVIVAAITAIVTLTASAAGHAAGAARVADVVRHPSGMS
jgi:hypothetical protein